MRRSRLSPSRDGCSLERAIAHDASTQSGVAYGETRFEDRNTIGLFAWTWRSGEVQEASSARHKLMALVRERSHGLAHDGDVHYYQPEVFGFERLALESLL